MLTGTCPVAQTHRISHSRTVIAMAPMKLRAALGDVVRRLSHAGTARTGDEA